MKPLALLIATASDTQRDIELALDRLRARGGSIPDCDGRHWRTIAACQEEYDVLLGKAQLADQAALAGLFAGEFQDRWSALESRAKGLVQDAT